MVGGPVERSASRRERASFGGRDAGRTGDVPRPCGARRPRGGRDAGEMVGVAPGEDGVRCPETLRQSEADGTVGQRGAGRADGVRHPETLRRSSGRRPETLRRLEPHGGPDADGTVSVAPGERTASGLGHPVAVGTPAKRSASRRTKMASGPRRPCGGQRPAERSASGPGDPVRPGHRSSGRRRGGRTGGAQRRCGAPRPTLGATKPAPRGALSPLLGSPRAGRPGGGRSGGPGRLPWPRRPGGG
ncbi:hypothetical protein SUDANB105_05676 [Streptomyces sp. enrichment culture]